MQVLLPVITGNSSHGKYGAVTKHNNSSFVTATNK